MDNVRKELESRRGEIGTALELLFKANMKITDWDIPEADDKEAAKMLLDMMQTKLDSIKADVESGKYDNY
jgi:DNA repair exonuclease SbcCD ATPase subunit